MKFQNLSPPTFFEHPKNVRIFSWDYLEEIGAFRFLSQVFNNLLFDFENVRPKLFSKFQTENFKNRNFINLRPN